MASKGRPNIEQLTGQGPALDTIRDFEPDKTARTHQNMLYQAMGDKFVTDHADEIPGAERLRKGRGCLEQLGRMMGKYANTSVIKAANIAANALTAGRTVKQVEAYLRHGRTTGELDESLLTATREAASNTAKPVDGLTLDDLRAIEWILDIEIQVYVKDIEAFSRMDDKDEAIIALGNRARFIEYYQQKLQAAIKSAGGELKR